MVKGKIIEYKSKGKYRRELANIKILETSEKRSVMSTKSKDNVITKRVLEEQTQIISDTLRDMIFCNLVENN
jgi:hypothetical protein